MVLDSSSEVSNFMVSMVFMHSIYISRQAEFMSILQKELVKIKEIKEI